tara:strand:- start:793 stop:1020 length:228 start_codon:yes stop_codon:yes gene_type:complete
MSIPDLGNTPPDTSKATNMKCDECGNDTFKQTLMLARLSALMSPTGQETIVPSAVFACEKCGHVNEEFKNLEMGQ